jgi:hypothetical protein
MTASTSARQVRRAEAFQVWLRPDGAVQVTWSPGPRIELDTARGATDAIQEVSGGQPRGLLVDMRGTVSMDREARSHFASRIPNLYAVALWVESPLSQMLANFFLGVNRPPIPTRLFTDEAKAVAWLKSRSPGS